MVDIQELRKRITHDRLRHQWNKKHVAKLIKVTDQVKTSKNLKDAWEYCAVAFKNLELSSASLTIFENAEWHPLQEWQHDASCLSGKQKSCSASIPWTWTLEYPIQLKNETRLIILKLKGMNDSSEMRSIMPLLNDLAVEISKKNDSLKHS